MKFCRQRIIAKKFDDAVAAVTGALKNEGFGVISTIDLSEKFREKLGIAFRKYVILGACNPSLAYKALQIEDTIGVMLPCNVVIQDRGEGTVEVAAIDPAVTMAAVGNESLSGVAAEVSEKLSRVMGML